MEEETFANQSNLVVQPDSKRFKLGRILCCCVKKQSKGLPDMIIQEDQQEEPKFMQPVSAIDSGFVDLGGGTQDITKNISINNNSEIPSQSNESARSENISASKDQVDTNRALKLLDGGEILQRKERRSSNKLN